MIKLVCFIHRRADMGRQAFHQHWRESHGPLIEGIPDLRRLVVRYEQNLRLAEDYARDEARDEAPDADRAHAKRGGPDDSPAATSDFDGATIMWFESMAEYEAFAAHPLYAKQIAPDEARFMDRARTLYFFTAEEEAKIGGAPEKSRAQVKLLALLARKPGLSIADFHAHWSGPHGDLFRETPALRDKILAYDQNHRFQTDYTRDPATPWDGMAEQWYASLEAFYAGAGGGPFEEIVAPDEERFMDRKATRFILCHPAQVVFSAD